MRGSLLQRLQQMADAEERAGSTAGEDKSRSEGIGMSNKYTPPATIWHSDGRRLYATRGGLKVSAEVPVRGQYNDARLWLRLLRIEIILLAAKLDF